MAKCSRDEILGFQMPSERNPRGDIMCVECYSTAYKEEKNVPDVELEDLVLPLTVDHIILIRNLRVSEFLYFCDVCGKVLQDPESVSSLISLWARSSAG